MSKLLCKFPLPYSSLSSLYLGLIANKSCDWFYVTSNTKWNRVETSSINFNDRMKWKIAHTSVIVPNIEYQTYKLFLRLRLGISGNKPTEYEYIEDLSVEHIVNDTYHFSIYSVKKENGRKVKEIVSKNKKWLQSEDIHHIIL
jgi:hypothetical protein